MADDPQLVAVGPVADALADADADADAISTGASVTEASPPAVSPDAAAEAGTQPAAADAADAAAVAEPLAATPASTHADWIGQWQALPVVADAALAQRLDRQFAAWQQRNAPAQPQAASASTTAAAGPKSESGPPRRAAKAGPRPALDDAQRARLAQLLDQAAAALADGRLASLQQHLQALDQALAKVAELPAGDPLHQRGSALQAEYQRLKDWQHWGGSRARDGLVTEAEALARAAGVPLPARKPGPGAGPAFHPAARQEPGQPAEPPAQGDAPSAYPTPSVEVDAVAALAPAQAAASTPPPEAVVQPDRPVADPLAEPAAVPQTALNPVPAVAAGEPAAEASASPPEAQPDDPPDDPPEPAPQPLDPAQPRPPLAPKLDLKAHADAIASLRTRWRELDRLGGVAKPALWHRFDTALTAAHQPLAQRQAAQKAARQDNLRARQALLDTLDALPDAAGVAGVEGNAPAAAGTDLKESLRALDRFHTAWRQLGPVEHTVPSGARDALTQRWQRSVGRIEAPLLQARRGAQARREQLIAQAQNLATELVRNPQQRDANQQVRALQADWQQQARAMPLARGIENALWGQFKAAIDGVFVQREAAWSARDAEQSALLADREALLASLQALGAEPSPDAKPVDMQRALAELDRAWRQGPELPRSAVGAAMEARYRDARAALQQTLADAARQRWQAQCDGLTARLSLCEQREQALASGGDGSADDILAQGWAQLDASTEASGAPSMPTDWAQALGTRKQGSGPAALAGPLSAAAFDTLLLQLEAALELPASAEQQAARRLLKLQALKDSMEGRASADTGPAAQAHWLISALRQSGARPAQRQRLHKVLAALRQAAAGSLGVPAPRA